MSAVVVAVPVGALAEQGSQPASPAAGRLDAGGHFSCALRDDSSVRCWGFSGSGQLGSGNTNTIGDDEPPGSVGPVNLGTGRTATAISAGDFHTCALLDDGSVRCWGFGAEGRLGYGNTNTIGDDEPPGSVGPVNLGPGRTATAIAAGAAHTCALLDDGSVRCWGFGANGRLGYGATDTIGDDEVPGSVGPVNLGPGRTATTITAGGAHTCVLLDNGSVRCWGFGGNGQLGYGNTNRVGDDEVPGSVGPVNLGPGRTATAITAGYAHTCARLDDGTVRCWGFGFDGRLGYGNQSNIGDDEPPGSVAPVDLGPGRTATAISAGGAHTCAVLDDGSVRCWGDGGNGRLGYGNKSNIGDHEPPGSVAPVDLGIGRTATAITAGGAHTCARLDEGSVRCWGFGGNGRLGYCNQTDVGDDEAPASAGPVDLETPGSGCGASGAAPGIGGGSRTAPGIGGDQSGGGVPVGPALGSPAGPSLGPGPVTGVRARAISKSKIVLTFRAAGTNGSRPPPARAYLVKQSRRPIRDARAFRRAQTLCKGRCRFPVPSVGAKIKLTVTDLRPKSTYYYAITARDNSSSRLGPRSKTAKARTR